MLKNRNKSCGIFAKEIIHALFIFIKYMIKLLTLYHIPSLFYSHQKIDLQTEQNRTAPI